MEEEEGSGWLGTRRVREKKRPKRLSAFSSSSTSSSLIQIDPTALLLLLFAKRSLSVALAEKESGKWLAIIY